MKKLVTTVIIFLGLTISTFAQGNEFIFTWQIAPPIEPLSNIISKTSFQGWAFEYRRAFSKTITVGGSVGWHVFHQEIEKSTWNFDNVAITSRNWRYTHTVPITANFHYNLLRNEQSKWQFFGGLGIGAAYVNQEIWAGMYTFRNETWGFHAFPEIGMRYVMSDQTAFFLSTQFMTIFNGHYTDDHLSYWNIRLGFSFGRHKW
jgi:hypothetical protein